MQRNNHTIAKLCTRLPNHFYLSHRLKTNHINPEKNMGLFLRSVLSRTLSFRMSPSGFAASKSKRGFILHGFFIPAAAVEDIQVVAVGDEQDFESLLATIELGDDELRRLYHPGPDALRILQIEKVKGSSCPCSSCTGGGTGWQLHLHITIEQQIDQVTSHKYAIFPGRNPLPFLNRLLSIMDPAVGVTTRNSLLCCEHSTAGKAVGCPPSHLSCAGFPSCQIAPELGLSFLRVVYTLLGWYLYTKIGWPLLETSRGKPLCLAASRFQVLHAQGH